MRLSSLYLKLARRILASRDINSTTGCDKIVAPTRRRMRSCPEWLSSPKSPIAPFDCWLRAFGETQFLHPEQSFWFGLGFGCIRKLFSRHPPHCLYLLYNLFYLFRRSLPIAAYRHVCLIYILRETSLSPVLSLSHATVRTEE